MLQYRLCHHQSLRSPESPEGRVRRLVGFANAASDVDGVPGVAVVAVEEGSVDDWLGEVQGAAAVGVEVSPEELQLTSAAAASFVFEVEGVTLT